MPDSQTEANVRLSDLAEADIPLPLDMLYALGRSDGVSQIITSKAVSLSTFSVRPRSPLPGRSAMAALASIALANGCSRIEWYQVKDNPMSHGFYASIGAHLLEQMAIGRLSGRNLTELAQISPAAN
ncbi:GNAT family N-acetyltransferase [Shewanella salipaludis]|uniref:GNAT family N-acetyltransferase n=1 Tax=Shewanella salipaludis TaxID=2723052 RepID=A0A972FVK7_9GAMM|nr:GNAT family N-acetyltransferase [Shewanella salipaludis]NMH64063.1 GNAT family N-acetyltransferase [Shewanella salipaludis]